MLQIDTLNSDEEIENFIPTPKNFNSNTKELFIDGESKLGKVDKEIDSFANISGINKENNEIINDNSLLVIKKNISKSNLNKNKIIQKLENKFNNVFKYKKIDLTSSIKNNFDYNVNNHKQNIYESSKQIIKTINKIENKFDFKSIRINNNERKYNLLFERNKKMDINSLREEYFKIKHYHNFNSNYDSKQNENKKEDKNYINILNNENDKKNSYKSININFDNFKKIKRQNKFNNIDKKKEYFINNINLTNNNSKERLINEDSKFKIFGKELNKKKSSYSLLNINFYDNNKHKNKFKNIYNSLRDLNKNINSKNEENGSWLLNTNENRKIQNVQNLSNNYNKIKYLYNNPNLLNKRNLKDKNTNFKFVIPKSYLIDYKKNITKNRSKILLSNKNSILKNRYYYNLTNEEKRNDNITSIKKEKSPFNKITENSDNMLDKLNNEFDDMFNLVESRIKQNSNNDSRKKSIINDFNSRYKYKSSLLKLNSKLLSISHNEQPKKNDLIKPFKENCKISYQIEKNFKFSSRNKLSIQITEDISPFRKEAEKEFKSDNYQFYKIKEKGSEFFRKNKTKKLLNLL